MTHPDMADFSAVQKVLSGRWMLPTLRAVERPLRFGGIQQALGGLARGPLSNQLHQLHRLGLVSRTCYPGFPPRVEYCATERGAALLEILREEKPAAVSLDRSGL